MILILSPSANFCYWGPCQWQKNQPNLSLGNKIYDIFQRHYVLWNGFFCLCKEICRWNPILSLSDKFWQRQVFYETPPGLVVTRATCYSCVFSITRRQQEFLVIPDEEYFKPTLHAKFWDHLRQQEKVMAKKRIFNSSSNLFTFSKIYLAPKNIQLHLEIDKVEKWSIPVVYIDGIITALCAWVFD